MSVVESLRNPRVDGVSRPEVSSAVIHRLRRFPHIRPDLSGIHPQVIHMCKLASIRHLICLIGRPEGGHDGLAAVVTPFEAVGRRSAASELRGDLGHLVVDRAAFLHELADLLVGVHDRGVIAIAEQLSDLRQRETGALSAEVHGDLS